jgi:hypothetical protein
LPKKEYIANWNKRLVKDKGFWYNIIYGSKAAVVEWQTQGT